MDKVITKIDSGCRDAICLPMLKLMKVERPRTVITVLFLISSVLVLVAFIVGCVVAADLQRDDDKNDTGFSGSLQFAAVFSSLLYIALTIAGTVILRKYKTPLSIGALIGFVFVISNLCLILCAIFANVADVVDDDDVDRPFEAFATFQFFLFTVYAIFGMALSVFRNDLIEVPTFEEDEKIEADPGAPAVAAPAYDPSHVTRQYHQLP